MGFFMEYMSGADIFNLNLCLSNLQNPVQSAPSVIMIIHYVTVQIFRSHIRKNVCNRLLSCCNLRKFKYTQKLLRTLQFKNNQIKIYKKEMMVKIQNNKDRILNPLAFYNFQNLRGKLSFNFLKICLADIQMY